MNRADLGSDRVKAGAGVALLHALLGYALITHPGDDVVQRSGEALAVFDVIEPPPPPEAAEPARKPSDRSEGAASPHSRSARPTPVVAPPPRIRLPKSPPLPSVPKSTPVPPGSATSAGVSTLPGPGTGTGGVGSGIGSGGQGAGAGSGRAARAQRIAGRLDNSDYPRAALRAGHEGTVSVRYTVEADGRVGDCRVTRSSGHAELDETTCRLVERRFRYRPARDAAGRPVPETVRKTFDWLVPVSRAPSPDIP